MKNIISLLFCVCLIKLSNGQTHAKFDSTRYEIFLEVTLANGTTIQLHDGDTIVNTPDSAISACVKISDIISKEVYEPTDFDGLFVIRSQQPWPMMGQHCLNETCLRHYNRLMNSTEDRFHIRWTKFKNSENKRVVAPEIVIGRKRRK